MRSLLLPGLMFSAAFAAVITLVISVIHEQPYDDSALRDFLFNSPGCETYPDDHPCLIGIRPRITTADEAQAILRAHQWVDQTRDLAVGPPAIYFSWGAQSPQRFASECSRSRYGGIIYLSSERVTQIVVACSSVTFGALYHLAGLPDEAYTYVPNPGATAPRYQYVANFTALGLGLEGPLECPASTRMVWDVHGSLTFRQPSPPAASFRLGC